MATPKLLRLDPALPLSFRPSGNLILGYPDIPASQAIEIKTQSMLVASWLRLLDGTRTNFQLIQSAQALGINSIYVQELLEHLLQVGHVRYTPDVSMQQQFATIELIGAGVLPARVFALLRSYGVTVGWNPDSNQRIRLSEIELAQLSPDHLGRRWRDLSEIHEPAQIEVIFAEVFDPEKISENVLVLPVTWHQRRIAIGPYLNFTDSHTAACISADHQTREPDWNYLLTQILHQHHNLGLISNPWLEIAANQIVGLLTTLTSGRTNELLDNQYEMIPPNPLMRFREVSLAECNCVKRVA